MVQEVESPDRERTNPESHSNRHDLEDANVLGQVPSVPFTGAVTEHALGTQVCTVSVPRRHDVDAPVSV
jgi:hypothetical protein